MRDHDGARPRAERGFELGDVDLEGGRSDVEENRFEAILDDGVYGGGEAYGYGDDFAGFLWVTGYKVAEKRNVYDYMSDEQEALDSCEPISALSFDRSWVLRFASGR